MLVVEICSVPEPEGMTVDVVAGQQQRIAAVCRRVWVVTCLVLSDGSSRGGG